MTRNVGSATLRGSGRTQRMLASVRGIGKKKAARLIRALEVKEKVQKGGAA